MIQAWIDEQGWAGLRPIQEQAFPIVAERSTDVLLRAGTASGKTEAAFLPILSTVLSDGDARGSVRCLCVSPMKALINDQYARLEALGRYCDVSVARWHGDVPAAEKAKARDHAPEILVITPESLEMQLARHSNRWGAQMGDLDWIVVDELHLFLGRARGLQLESLMHRIDLLVGRRIPRVGLSATLGSTDEAERVLGGPEHRQVTIVSDGGASVPFVHEVIVTAPVRDREGEESSDDDDYDAVETISDHGFGVRDDRPTPDTKVEDTATPAKHPELEGEVWRRYPGASYVLFANSRTMVEHLADGLPRRRLRHDVSVAPHHGSLSTDKRLDAERLLLDRESPSIVVATSTLEVGIDVPAVAAVGQVGAPLSVAALRQRLGRSGRRGSASRVDVFVPMSKVSSRSHLMDLLRPDLVHALAALELALEGWVEPAAVGTGQLSTLVHQIVSVVAQHGGLNARRLHDVVIGSGAFAPLGEREFVDVVRGLGASGVLEQDEQRDFVLGERGEALANSPSFAAVFETPVEYVVMDGGASLGSLIRQPWMRPGDPLVFAGRRWTILTIEDRQSVIRVQSATRRKLPTWAGGVLPVHPGLRARMREIHERGSELELPMLARHHLEQAKATYLSSGLLTDPVHVAGATATLFLYGGTLQHETIVAMLRSDGIEATDRGIGITLVLPEDGDLRGLVQRQAGRAVNAEWDPVELAKNLCRRTTEKFDGLVPDDLLLEETARTQIDLAGALALLRTVVASS